MDNKEKEIAELNKNILDFNNSIEKGKNEFKMSGNISYKTMKELEDNTAEFISSIVSSKTIETTTLENLMVQLTMELMEFNNSTGYGFNENNVAKKTLMEIFKNGLGG